ncbi:MAG: DUF438 domain-containing protein [Anaerolineae bacterium]|nr:DUF438 domain-containing protein [Anaerolineae bacterium]
MSEYINNNTRRKELLKDILKSIHEGRPLDEVKQRFAELVKIADSGEIAEVEQTLIAEGLPVEEVQRLCDVHVSVVRQALDQNTPADAVPGHPVFTFRAENKAAERFLEDLGMAVEAYASHPDEKERKTVMNILEQVREFERHYLRKENLLFPLLERYGFSGPSQVMWGIHDQIRAGWKQMKSLLEKIVADSSAQAKQIKEVFEGFEMPMQEMFYKEEKILFPAAMERLKEEDWAAIRDQESELGYYFVRPGTLWKTAAQVILDEEAGFKPKKQGQTLPVEGLINLSTGQLSAEQINLLLTNLPVDVTFVDEKDEVRFFSQTKERIFDRQPAIIGRKVQFCHPPKSLDKVQRILDDFKAGNRDVAEFWIEMMGKFIHIRYYAMRDAQGNYRGTLEVSQDVSGIRALKGERRLLDD